MDDNGIPYSDRHKLFPLAITKHGRDIRKKVHQLGKAAKVRIDNKWYYWNYFGFPLSGFEGLIEGVTQRMAGADNWMNEVEWTVSVECVVQHNKYATKIARVLFDGDNSFASYWAPAFYEVYNEAGEVVHTLVPLEAQLGETEYITLDSRYFYIIRLLQG